jgi:hypothetical protein
MTIKRIDRTKQLITDLEKSASAAVKEAAIMLKVIAREMVSRRYTKTTKQAQRDAGANQWDPSTIIAERAKARAGFVNRVDTGARKARAEASFQMRLDRARRKARS